MADDKRIGVRGEWVDGVSGPYQQTAKKIESASKTMSKKTGKFVSEGMGKNLSQFNEKTEKGRQLMSAFGGSLGAAGGQATYYAGTLSYVIGRFSAMEAGIMLLIGGLVALGVKISQLASEHYNKLMETTKELLEDTRKFREEIDKLEESMMQSFANMTRAEVKYHEIRRRAMKMTSDIAELEAERQRLIADASSVYLFRSVGAQKTITEEIDKRIHLLKAEYSALQINADQMQRMIKIEAERSEKTGGRKGGRAKAPEAIDVDMGRFLTDYEMLFGMLVPRGTTAAMRERSEQEINLMQYEQMMESSNQQLIALAHKRVEEEGQAEEWLFRIKESIRKRDLQKDIDAAQARNRVVENSISLFGELGQLAAQNAQQATAARIATIILEAGYRVVQQMAEGFAALGAAQPWLAAQHFTSAGLYAALAAGNVAQTASGGGSGGMGGGSRQAVRDYGGREEPEEKQTTIIVELGGREVGRAIMDATRKAEQERNPGATRSRLSD